MPEIIQNIFFSLKNIEDKFFEHYELKYEKKFFLPGVPQRSWKGHALKTSMVPK